MVWSPYHKCNIEAFQRVLGCFTKRLPGFGEHGYSERLGLLQLVSLELRRHTWAAQPGVWGTMSPHFWDQRGTGGGYRGAVQ